ncbi:MAG: hypothetical protein SVO01_00435 [Thermotogota bacterium]|nr:hypothetical protein [Thermotogota bacterium]
MASICILTDPPTDIDYSIFDKRVCSFELRGKLLYDEDEGISRIGWKKQLVDFVKEQGLNINEDDRGLHAFVYGLIEEGLIEEITR